jgi:hypothetical protein
MFECAARGRLAARRKRNIDVLPAFGCSDEVAVANDTLLIPDMSKASRAMRIDHLDPVGPGHLHLIQSSASRRT